MSVLLTDAEAEEVLTLLNAIIRRGGTRPAAYDEIAEKLSRHLDPNRADNYYSVAEANARLKGA